MYKAESWGQVDVNKPEPYIPTPEELEGESVNYCYMQVDSFPLKPIEEPSHEHLQ